MNDLNKLSQPKNYMTTIIPKKDFGDVKYLSLKRPMNEDIRKMINKIKSFQPLVTEDVNRGDFLRWKRKNVTLRGIKELNQENNVYGSFGKGLYTTPLSNKAMARQYGKVFFVVGAIPKRPKVVQNLNDAEIWRQHIVNNFCKQHGREYRLQFFEEHTSMEKEMLEIGYDGLIIKGREMVNYTPDDIKYFHTIDDLETYYFNHINI